MRPNLILNFLLLYCITSAVFSQEKNHNFDNNEEDSTAVERRKRYEETLKFIEEMKKRREKDPEGYADSITRIREQKRFEKASARIDAYRQSQNISELKEIDLTGARLKEVPDWVFEATNMEVLVLDNNAINVLPQKLAELKSLKRIYWRYNYLGNGKIKIPKLIGIEKLDLTGNSLSKLPKVNRLDGLEELVLEKNSFTKIPTWKGRRLKALKELDLSQNPIELDRKWYRLIDHLEILKLNKCEIDALHTSFYKMEGLQELQIQVNNLDSIPAGISALKNLTKLSFYKNNLQEMPIDFYSLEKLRVVDLYYNQLEKIPEEIGKLKNLEILYLSFNKLYDLPDKLGELRKLEELYIHHNRLSTLPGSIQKLEKLGTLHFQHNYFPNFPMHILEMNSLTDLDISDTDIKSIPSDITKLKLKTLYWRNLEINLNDLGNRQSANALIRLMEQGTNVVPNISMHELSGK
ncbi:MAG: leucine-rich repeat domain-containing protein [Ekhidna sp.]